MTVDVDEIETVSVVGAGEMGRGIAAVAALSGYEVFLQDIDESQLEEAKENIRWSYGKAVENSDVTEATTDRDQQASSYLLDA